MYNTFARISTNFNLGALQCRDLVRSQPEKKNLEKLSANLYTVGPRVKTPIPTNRDQEKKTPSSEEKTKAISHDVTRKKKKKKKRTPLICAAGYRAKRELEKLDRQTTMNEEISISVET